MEHMADLSPEAIQNIASVYNKDTLTVTNLNVTGNLKVNGNSNLGQWNIRDDRIGIPNRGDMHLHADKWLRLLETDKDTNTYATSTAGGGFAGRNLWCQDSAWIPNVKTSMTIQGQLNPAAGFARRFAVQHGEAPPGGWYPAGSIGVKGHNGQGICPGGKFATSIRCEGRDCDDGRVFCSSAFIQN
jgi:hypothetical protein